MIQDYKKLLGLEFRATRDIDMILIMEARYRKMEEVFCRGIRWLSQMIFRK